MMNKQEIIQLTNGLYRLTQLFPKKEPLRYKIRGIGIDILDKALRITDLRITNQYEYTNNDEGGDLKTEILIDLGIMAAFLEIAKEQKWVKEAIILEIERGYVILKDSIEPVEGTEKQEEPEQEAPVFQALMANQLPEDLVPVPDNLHKNRQRQERIMGIVREKGKVQVWEVKQVLPGVSKRTLRRDFEYLLSQGMVERIGEKNQTFYRVGQTHPQVVLL